MDICPKCGLPMIYIPHIEYDGTEYGSHEPYWECPDDCFFGDCTQGFYPECSRLYSECPGP